MTPQEQRIADLLQRQGVKFSQRFIPATNPNRPGLKLWGGGANWMIWHATANTNIGANAAMHARFVNEQQGGADHVSFHFVADDHEVIQLLPLDEVAWQAGDGYSGEGNRDGLSCETCVNADGNLTKTLQNAAALGRALMVVAPLPHSANTQHHQWSSYGKDCPRELLANNGLLWNVFMVDLAKPIPGEPLPVPVPPQPAPVPAQSVARYYPETRHSVGGAILSEFDKAGGLITKGYPITEEYQLILEDGRMYTVQLFQKAMAHWRPGEPVGWANIGAMYGRLAGVLKVA